MRCPPYNIGMPHQGSPLQYCAASLGIPLQYCCNVRYRDDPASQTATRLIIVYNFLQMSHNRQPLHFPQPLPFSAPPLLSLTPSLPKQKQKGSFNSNTNMHQCASLLIQIQALKFNKEKVNKRELSKFSKLITSFIFRGAH